MTDSKPVNMSLPIQHDTRPPLPDCGCAPLALPRREFLKIAGFGMVSVASGLPQKVMAGPFREDQVKDSHLVPIDKQLDPDWVRSLFDRGEKEIYRGEQLKLIGMPCGGIGSGQLYLCGDGTLGCWQIFNNALSNWVGETHSTWEHREIAKPVEQGFAVVIAGRDGQLRTHVLSAMGFADVRFKGEYPIATVSYADSKVPVSAEMEAFSPFVPLNMKDSGYPATVFNITLKNTSDGVVEAGIAGWLENAVCSLVGAFAAGQRVTEVTRKGGRGSLFHQAIEAAAGAGVAEKAPVVFEDFEGKSFEGWTVEGTAFGDGPANGAIVSDGQQPVTDFEGEQLANSFHGGDVAMGRLLSKPFTIEHKYINLKVGGGPHRDRTGVRLLVDGKPVRSVSGRASEQLSWASWLVAPLKGQEGRIEIFDNHALGWGHILVDQIEFSDTPRANISGFLESQRDYGTMALVSPHAATGPGDDVLSGMFENPVVRDGKREAPLTGKLIGQLATDRVRLEPGAEHTFTFVLAWHFPNAEHGQYYATRFPDAAAVAGHVLDNSDRLTGDTRLWRDTYYDSTLPYWLLDRLHASASTLATGTCEWWANGRFYAFEGVTCCAGTCTHVWNYAHTHARLFPELGRNIRAMQDFNPRHLGGGYHPETGLVGFRSDDNYAADGQCGTILKAYREHLTSPDNTFLHRFWPRIKMALRYSIAQDGDNDGLIENQQHNTYDINYHGANTFVGALYLAALRAGEEMAREVGDTVFAEHCRAIFESGSRLTVKRLWDGEYFIQDVDLDKHPDHQYGRGCLSDQLFGQGWAHQVGLGYLYPQEKVRSAMEAVWKYNWAPDITPYNKKHKPFRWFISAGQGGLFTCTWPKSEYLPKGTMYKNEVWTGIEFQVAGHMVAEGLVTEGLAICRAIHDRYRPEVYNPYNEVECGDHYARAMAAWGVYLSLAGFEYHGPHQHIGFQPQVSPENFRVAFTAAEGWGTFEQKQTGGAQSAKIIIRWGRMPLQTMRLALPEGRRASGATASIDGRRVGVRIVQDASKVMLTFDEPVELEANDELEVVLT